MQRYSYVLWTMHHKLKLQELGILYKRFINIKIKVFMKLTLIV